MSKWAAIVYGRTYHQDFRFITVPQDFSAQDLNWASAYIVATTRQARYLSGSPRWSLVKNSRYCIVGITCTIKDLLGHTVKDDRDRPLYGFFGYVTPLTLEQTIDNLPPYSDRLDDFKILYREIERVWSVKSYERDRCKPTLSQYRQLNFPNLSPTSAPLAPELNTVTRHRDKVYLWSNNPEQNNLLWRASAQSSISVATCLNIKGKPLINSSFLNQSNHQAEKFQILERALSPNKSSATTTKAQTSQANPTLSQIRERAKEDLDLTLQQAAKVALAGRELIDRLDGLNNLDSSPADNSKHDTSTNELGFGFKKKLLDGDRITSDSNATAVDSPLEEPTRNWF